MDRFTRLRGIAAPLLRDNIDTDAIIPSRENQGVSRDGYGAKLFANWRYAPGTRVETADFVLNCEPYRHAEILLSGSNFGCGSSREGAVWALRQFGIRAVIAESFGNIFHNNCIRNGVLPVALPGDAVAAIAAAVEQSGGSAQVTVDLQACTVSIPSGQEFHFTLDSLQRDMLLAGLDEIDLTLQRLPEIRAFQASDRAARPWIYAP